MKADERADVHDGEDDRGVEDVPAPVDHDSMSPRAAPEQEEEERDREEERDPQQSANRREHLPEREDDDDGRDRAMIRKPRTIGFIR